MLNPIREAVSPERLVRAIKAHLVIHHGARSPYIAMSVRVQAAQPETDRGSNWMLDPGDAVEATGDGRRALEAAAANVAQILDIEE